MSMDKLASQNGHIRWGGIPSPVFLKGNSRIAYRDPAGHFFDGLFHVFHTQVHKESDGRYHLFTAVVESRNLVDWSAPRILTPRDQGLNYSSPGNVIRGQDNWLLCLQTYPTPNNQLYGDQTARIFTMTSDDLVTWGEPQLIRVKGPDVAREEMGRMIDPYLVQDKDESGKWWCFYKQNGASLSFTHDFCTWTFFGRIDAGENVCVLVDSGEYVLFHSPRNGVGVKRSRDLVYWTDHGLLTLGQESWPWSQGRLTAGHVLDLRHEDRVGKFVMFFHGTPPGATAERETHGNASLALAWSDDLVHWEWPRDGQS